MKNIFILTIFYFTLSSLSFSQNQSIDWQLTFGGSLYEYSREIEYTSDGGFINAGYSASVDGNISSTHGGGDCWIVKHDASGSIQWERTYGGSGFDYASSIQQTLDGGFIIAGYSESTDGDVAAMFGNGDCWIIKIDVAGGIQWQKTYGGTAIDNAQSIKQTIDGGYIVAAYSESSDGNVTGNHGAGDCWIMKLDGAGALVWEKSLGGTNYDIGQDIIQTSDGGYVLTGGTHSNDGNASGQNGDGDCWLVKLSCSGNVLWQNSLGGTNYDFGQSVIQTVDGGFIIAGYSESNDGDVSMPHGNGDCWVVKCDSAGSLQWQKALGSSENDYAFSIQQLMNGNYIMTGYSGANDGDVVGNKGGLDCWIVNLDPFGGIEVQSSLGGSGVDIGYSLRELTPGNYTIAGYSESNDGDVSGNQGNGDCWLIKIHISYLGITDDSIEEAVTVFPNPSSGIVTLSGIHDGSDIIIYDVAGKLVFQTKSIGVYATDLDLSGQSRGLYFYNVVNKNGKKCQGKILIN